MCGPSHKSCSCTGLLRVMSRLQPASILHSRLSALQQNAAANLGRHAAAHGPLLLGPVSPRAPAKLAHLTLMGEALDSNLYHGHGRGLVRLSGGCLLIPEVCVLPDRVWGEPMHAERNAPEALGRETGPHRL